MAEKSILQNQVDTMVDHLIDAIGDYVDPDSAKLTHPPLYKTA